MDEFSIEILASAAGVAAIVVAIISLFRVLWPWGLSVSVLRILSVVLGVGLAALASFALIGPVAPDDPAVAPLILFWLFVGLNGATAGLAASAGFDTAKYGIDRTTVKNGVAVSGIGADRQGPVNESPAFAPNDGTVPPPPAPRDY